jgi:hypothetical protein
MSFTSTGGRRNAISRGIGNGLLAGAVLLTAPLAVGCLGPKTPPSPSVSDNLSERVLGGQRAFLARLPEGRGWYLGTVKPEVVDALQAGKTVPAVADLHTALRRGRFDPALAERVFDGRAYTDADIIPAVAAQPTRPVEGDNPGTVLLMGWARRDPNTDLAAFNRLPDRKRVAIQFWNVEDEWHEDVYSYLYRS